MKCCFTALFAITTGSILDRALRHETAGTLHGFGLRQQRLQLLRRVHDCPGRVQSLFHSRIFLTNRRRDGLNSTNNFNVRF